MKGKRRSSFYAYGAEGRAKESGVAKARKIE